MSEYLNDKLSSMDENVAKIVDASLNQLQIAISSGDYHDQTALRHAVENVKNIGDALKALADGLETYKKVSNDICTASIRTKTLTSTSKP